MILSSFLICNVEDILSNDMFYNLPLSLSYFVVCESPVATFRLKVYDITVMLDLPS